MANTINNEVRVGCVGRTVTNEKFIVVEIVTQSRIRIRFLDEFGAEFVRRKENVEKGTIKNPYAITSWGVGRIGICNHTDKERTFWRRLMKKYSEGKLPHFNKRWLVLEYFLEDIRTLTDYDLLCRQGVIVYDPFGRYDRLEHLKVSLITTYARGIVRYDLFSKEYDVYTCREECAWETGYSANTIFHYCHNQSERDGFKFYYADEFVTDHPEFF